MQVAETFTLELPESKRELLQKQLQQADRRAGSQDDGSDAVQRGSSDRRAAKKPANDAEEEAVPAACGRQACTLDHLNAPNTLSAVARLDT